MDHYRTLNIEPSASPAQVRTAFREAARVHHPDAHGGSSDRMASINEAWRVLGNAASRAAYDAGIRSQAEPPHASSPAPSVVTRPAQTVAPDVEPARFPWRFMLAMAAVGMAFVVFGAVTFQPSEAPPPDRLVGAGSCVVFEPNGDAAEVLCTAPFDGVVESIVAFDGVCPVGLEPHRDKQGLGIACVRLP